MHDTRYDSDWALGRAPLLRSAPCALRTEVGPRPPSGTTPRCRVWLWNPAASATTARVGGRRYRTVRRGRGAVAHPRVHCPPWIGGNTRGPGGRLRRRRHVGDDRTRPRSNACRPVCPAGPATGRRSVSHHAKRRLLSRRLLGTRWRALCYPDHLFCFNCRSLRALLSEAGLRPAAVWTEGIDPYEIGRVLRGKRLASGGGPTDGAEALRTAAVNSRACSLAKSSVNTLLNTLRLGDTLRLSPRTHFYLEFGENHRPAPENHDSPNTTVSWNEARVRLGPAVDAPLGSAVGPRDRSAFRSVHLAFTALLPGVVKRFVYRYLFGYRIGRDVRIGISLLDADSASLADGTRIGHLNVIVRVGRFETGAEVRIGVLNIIRGGERVVLGRLLRGHAPQRPQRHPGPRLHDGTASRCCEVGAGTVITSGHRIDFTDRVTLGKNVIIGGRNSSLWTHNRQETAPIEIGDFCYLGSEVRLAPGAKLPDECILGIGAVLTGEITGAAIAGGGGAGEGGSAARRERPRADPAQDARGHAGRLLRTLLRFGYPLVREALARRVLLIVAGGSSVCARRWPTPRVARSTSARTPRGRACSGWAASTSRPTCTSATLGIDTNVFYTPTDRQTDFTASGGPGLEIVKPFGRESRLRIDGGLDYLYFAKTESQRRLNGYGTALLDILGVKTRLAVEERYERTFSRPNYEVNDRVEQETEGTEALLRRDLGDRMRLALFGSRQRTRTESYDYLGTNLGNTLTTNEYTRGRRAADRALGEDAVRGGRRGGLVSLPESAGARRQLDAGVRRVPDRLVGAHRGLRARRACVGFGSTAAPTRTSSTPT